MFQIKAEQFEGPLAVLLELIEKNKLDITQLSLAKVTDDYLAYLERTEGIDLANLSEFLLIASQLILIKSKALLPLFKLVEEEEEEIEDLQQRLREYQKFKKAAEWLGQRWEKEEMSFSRPESNFKRSEFVLPNIKKQELRKIFTKIIAEIPTKEALKEEVLEKKASLEEKIVQIKRFLKENIEISFQRTVQGAQGKTEIIMTFLAVLELAKRRVVLVRQQYSFGEIILRAEKK